MQGTVCGAEHYSRLFDDLLGISLTTQCINIAPLKVMISQRECISDLITVSDPLHHLVVIGRPSCLASSHSTVEEMLQSALPLDNPLENLAKRLQGDFVAIHVDRKTLTWEVRSDGLGMGRLFAHKVGGQFLLSDSVFAIASCFPLPLDEVYCCMLDISEVVWGNKTLYSGVSVIEMGESVVGDRNSSRLTRVWHFADTDGPEPSVSDIVEAYGDAFIPRLSTLNKLHHCMTGGVDSRALLSMLMYHGIEPSLFFARTVKADCDIAYHVANELCLDCYTTGKHYHLGREQTPTRSLMAELLLTEGHTRAVFGVRDYRCVVGPNESICLGSFSEGLLRSIWGIAHAGMVFPTTKKIIDRLLRFGGIRFNRLEYVHCRSRLAGDALEYIRASLEHQAECYSSKDALKQPHYFFLRNRGARHHAQLLSGFNRISQAEVPCSYLSGACTAWRLPSTAYKNVKTCRHVIAHCDPRLSTFPFADGSPATENLSLLGRGKMLLNRKLKKVVVQFYRKTMKRSMGGAATMHSETVKKRAVPFWDVLPAWMLEDSERRTLELFRTIPRDIESRTAWLQNGHMKTVATLEFAARVHEGAFN